jgi:hypothetical protein
MSEQGQAVEPRDQKGATMSADKEVLPADERLRRMEGELQKLVMLCTQILSRIEGERESGNN